MSTQLLSYSPEQPFSRTSHKVSGSTTVSQLKPLEPLSQIPQATKLVFIDSSIEHISALVDGLRAGYQAYVISQTQDGIAQITHLLSKFQQVEAIHIVSHGTPGALQIGSAHLTIETAEQYSKQLKTWGRVLSLQGQLLIYGCEVAKGEHGGAFLRTLHQLTNANISASTTLTGSQAKGGDWVLDAQVGEAQASLAFDSNVLQTYEGIMAAEAYFLVDSPKNLLKSSTFGSGSFQLTNNSTTGQTISKITIDASSALFPDLVFDPDGTAGDTSGKGFTVDSDPGVGLVGHNFLNPKDGGFDALEIDFNNFQPGQTLTFSVDMDPTSTKGTQGPGPNHAASVSGFELTGATVTIKFSDGTVLQGQNYRVPNDDTASQVTLKSALPAAPTVEVLGVAGSTAAVTEASQTVRVAGPVGADIALLQVEGAFFEDPIIPAFDRDPFEANTAIAVEEFSGTIGVSGFIDIPVTLTSSDPDGGLNHFVAVIKEADGSTGATSPVIVLELGSVSGPDTTAPTATLNAIDLTTAGGTEYSFTVNYADETGLDEITTDLNDVVVTGPNGALTVTSSTDNGDSSVTYTVAAPGGDWDSADNGTYNITLQAGEVADTLGNSVAQQSLGSFDVTLAGPDVSPPVATLDADDITTAGAANHSFNIDYADASGLNAATIDVNDITVAGASGNLTITNTVDNGDGSVTYTVAAPGGDWGTADNGTYDVTLQAGEVSDTLGNSVTEQLLGSFTANIGNPPDPGSGLRIEAESYSNSFDRTAGNGGNATGFTDDVDVANTTDVEGVFHVNNIQKNEFLIYDNFNLQPGTYDLVARVATGQAQTKDRMKITIGSQEFVVNFGNTGGYNSWQDIVLPGVEIDAAAQEMRVDFVNGSFNLNYLEFQPGSVLADGPDVIGMPDVLVTAGTTNTEIDLFAAFEDAQDSDADLIYEIVSNSNPALLAASESLNTPFTSINGKLNLSYTSGATGQSEIIIKATNSEGGVAETVPITFTVVNPAPADNAIRINAGGGTAYNEDGNAFKNVSQLTGVSFVDNSAGSDASTLIVDNRTPIGNTQADTTTPTGPANNDSLYQTHRQGSDFSYAVDIANGSYNINFHFVEPEFEDNNQRLFDIKVENQVAFDNFDIYSTIKNAFLDGKDTVRVLQAPPQESFTAIVNDGTLNIDFEGVSGNATIAAIEILSTPPSIIIQESGGSSNISEENSTSDDYTVVLGTQPTSDVTVSLSFDAGQLTPDQASLVFTTENWQDPQTVTVSAVDDAEQEGIHTADISHTVTSSDPSYNGISVSDTTFTIQDNDQPAGPTPIKFDQKLIQATNKATAGAWGPDGRLYVGTLTGFIYAYTFDDTYDNITNTEVINTIAPLGNHEILGLAFNPYDSEPRIYVTHSHLEYNDGDAPLPTDPFPYTGEVSILDGANFTNRQSLISGLPVSNHDHGVNSLAFDNEGDLYIAVGGNTNAGISDPAIGGTAESPFSAAIVKANLTDPGLNISNPEYKGIKPDFNGQIEYELPVDIIVPPELTREEAAQSQVFGGDANVKAGIDVSVYASGFRNPFDLAWGTNGKLYASDNGANPGFGDVSTGPNTQEPFPGGQSDDEFLLVVEDGYYGFPNRNRGRTDDRQNYFIGPNGPLPNYLPPEASDPNFYTEPLTTYPKGGSNNGVVEYRATAFNGELKGNILVQKFKNQLWNIDLSADGNQVVDIVNLNQVSEAEGGTEVASGLDVLTGAGGAVVGIDFTANHVTIASPVDSSVSGVTAYDIFPWRAPIIGGHDFVIGGLNFDPNATTEVFVGGVEVTGQITVSDTRIRGILPNLTGQPNELLDIVVMNGGQTSIIPDAFQPLIG
ncbi:MAG: DUF4347 domain-containing protein [Cyanobacteria bacterium J06650_10]